MSDLCIPEEIILQILLKLPVKSLARFTCVSKSWLSLIKNHSFISNHLKLSNKNPLLLLRYCSYQNVYNQCTEHYSLYFDDEEEEEYNQYMHLYFPFKLPNDNPHLCFDLVGTINGLICLRCSVTNTIIIWNPSIKRSITLPKPSITSDLLVSLGLGFDSRSNDYKVLSLANRPFTPEEQEQDTLEAEIYSLNMNSWKTISAPRARVRCDTARQVFVNGVIHVLAVKRLIGDDSEYHNLILGFDIGDEVFNEIQLPQSLVNVLPFKLNVSVYKESSIAVFEQDWDVGYVGAYVWVMEEYGVVESWTKILSFNAKERVLGFRKNGELFLAMPDQEIVSCQPENNQEKKRLGVSGRYAFIDYFVESLELLDNANAQSYPIVVENDAIGDAAIGDAAGDAND